MSTQYILCVDDEKIVLNSLREQLRNSISEDVQIEVAENGEEALELISEIISDGDQLLLVISDYLMPGMKGDELLSKVHEMTPNSIKILLTGQATLDGVANIINKTNLFRYISKPWEIEDLALAVSKAIKIYEKDRQIEAQHIKLNDQNKQLIEWTESFVKTMSRALDSRDEATANHSRRIAKLALRMANIINNINYGKYKDFEFTSSQINELYYAALLHDIGKIGVREQILLKSQRVSEDQFKLISKRYKWLKLYLTEKKKMSELSSSNTEILGNLDSYIEFINIVNTKEYLTDLEVDKILEISKLEVEISDNEVIKLLNDYEIENLIVKYGNLTKDERQTIEKHAEYTYELLKSIPWPDELRNVPEIAASHHERVDGSGYFNGFSKSEISIQSRLLAILDVYEALTAENRSYRSPKTHEEAMNILKEEVDAGKLDRELFQIFVNEKLDSYE